MTPRAVDLALASHPLRPDDARLLLAVPFLCLGLAVLLARRRGGGLRESLLSGGVLCGVVAVALVEGLSLLGALRGDTLAVGWATVAVALAVRLRRQRSATDLRAPTRFAPTRATYAAFVALVALVGLSLVGAWVAAPATPDVGTYHLPRVLHWLHNESVRPYPTPILRQLHQPPAAEFLFLHAIALGGSTRCANLVQAAAFGGCTLATSLIVARLGYGRRLQLTTALLTATIPMALLQATSSKNDLVAALWLSTYAAFALGPARHDWRAAGSLGLAIATKGTVYVFAPALVIWCTVRLMRRDRPAALRAAALLVVAVAALNAGHWTRNTQVYGKPLGPGREAADPVFKYANDRFDAQALGSNLLRNAAFHVLPPWREGTAFVQHGVERVHAALRWSTRDPAYTWGGQPFELHSWAPHPAFAGSPIHALLLALALAVAVRRRRSAVLALAAVLLVGCVAFCWLLKWQPWHPRLHLPWFVLACPVAALGWAALRPRGLRVVVIGTLVASSVACTLFNVGRPWIGSRGMNIFTTSWTHQLFYGGPEYETVREVMRTLEHTGARRVGLIAGPNEAEFRLWACLPESIARLEHVLVDNVSGGLPPEVPGPPDAILATSPRGEQLVCRGRTYARSATLERFAVYVAVP